MAIPIVIKEARLRPSREKITTRIGTRKQAMRSLCGCGDGDALSNERLSLYNEGQAPLVIRDITINDVDWASIHPVQGGVDLKGMEVQPMSPPAELLVRIDSSVRASHSLSGTICISSNDPRPDILVPMEASSSCLRTCHHASVDTPPGLLSVLFSCHVFTFRGGTFHLGVHQTHRVLGLPLIVRWHCAKCRWCWHQCSGDCLPPTRRCRLT